MRRRRRWVNKIMDREKGSESNKEGKEGRWRES